MDEQKYSYKYPHPAITTDSVVFGFDGQTLHILLIERGIEPFKGLWALPGGFMRIDESAEQCAKRELKEETGVDEVYLEQFHTFSEVNRDPRERVVTVAFFALVRKSDYRLIAGDDAVNAQWFEIDELPPLAFDHQMIINTARQHIKEVHQTRPIAFRLLDEKFSIDELRRLYEAINETEYDRRNFAKKMLSTGFISKNSNDSYPAPCQSFNYSKSSQAEPNHINAAEYDCCPPPNESAGTSRKGRTATLYTFDSDAFEEENSNNPKPYNPFRI